MNILLLKKLSESNPALARALEVGLYSGLLYVLGAIIAGEPFNWHAVTVSLLTPLWAYIGKMRRDLTK